MFYEIYKEETIRDCLHTIYYKCFFTSLYTVHNKDIRPSWSLSLVVGFTTTYGISAYHH